MTTTTEPPGLDGPIGVAARHFRWNAVVLVLEATVFLAGMACLDTTTVLPVLLKQLGASDQTIGLMRFAGIAGFTLPALAAAHLIHGRRRHKAFLLGTVGIGRVFLFAVPAALLLLGRSHPAVAVIVVLGALTAYWLLDGLSCVSWFDIIAKTIPGRVRGRFFGVMQTLTGLASFGAGFVVASALRNPSLGFPGNFALLAGICCATSVASFVGLALVREPPGQIEEATERAPFRATLAAAPRLLRRYPLVFRLIVTRLLIDGAGVAAPFYVLFAREELSVSLGAVGVYAAVQSAGRVAGGPLWGWVTDRFGPAVGLRAVGGTVLAIPVLAIAAGHGLPWAYPAVFGLMGAVVDGAWMVTYNALLEAVPDGERPMAVGVATLSQAPSALYGVLGGFLAERTSFDAVFGVAAAFALCGVAAAARLRSQGQAGSTTG